MVERGGGPRFLLKAAEAIGIGRELRGQDLDGDIASEARIARAVDLAHAAGANGRDDLIRAEPRAGRECHAPSYYSARRQDGREWRERRDGKNLLPVLPIQPLPPVPPCYLMNNISRYVASGQSSCGI